MILRLSGFPLHLEYCRSTAFSRCSKSDAVRSDRHLGQVLGKQHFKSHPPAPRARPVREQRWARADQGRPLAASSSGKTTAAIQIRITY
jgi:hypothetical protein